MRLCLILWGLLFCGSSYAQQCFGGAIATDEAYLYGRFETRMRSATGDGIVSSFFMYNLDSECNWPAENNEIDVEMTGNTEDLYFTTHYPGPWFFTDEYDVSFNPHTSFHDYAFEWEPGIVRWFIDGNLVNVQAQPFVSGLVYPMRILMNLWVSDAVSWVGVFDPASMPATSEYEYVKCYSFTPGSGNYGTGNNFTHLWTDELDSYDSNRWTITEAGGFAGNECEFRGSSVNYSGGKMELTLEEPFTSTQTVPLTISVNMSQANVSGLVSVAGNFNNWCGNCTTMLDQGGGIYSRTINVPPGNYEFIFSINNWQNSSGPPLGSECDFVPCDEFANYGVAVPSGQGPVVLDTVCYGACNDCFDCPTLSGNFGDPCNDGNNNSISDQIQNDCSCLGIPQDITVFAKANLEGAMMSNGMMSTFLATSNLIPSAQPYNIAPFNYAGSETVVNFPANTVDWVLVELRSTTDPNLVLNQRAALIKSDGVLMDIDGSTGVIFQNASAGSYFVSINHRNHLGVMSSSAVSFPNSLTYDFSSSPSQVSGNDQLVNTNGVFSLRSGDIDGTGTINFLDFLKWFAENNLLNSYNGEDCDLTGTTNFLDFLEWFSNNNSLAVPEMQY